VWARVKYSRARDPRAEAVFLVEVALEIVVEVLRGHILVVVVVVSAPPAEVSASAPSSSSASSASSSSPAASATSSPGGFADRKGVAAVERVFRLQGLVVVSAAEAARPPSEASASAPSSPASTASSPPSTRWGGHAAAAAASEPSSPLPRGAHWGRHGGGGLHLDPDAFLVDQGLVEILDGPAGVTPLSECDVCLALGVSHLIEDNVGRCDHADALGEDIPNVVRRDRTVKASDHNLPRRAD